MNRFLIALAMASSLVHADPMIVHEWGTFTVLQDENGDGIPGINSDDEPVPSFVHRIAPLVRGPVSSSTKGPLPECHPDVRMRLETPVVYFYPPPGEHRTVDVEVSFPGGWISEYFPGGSVDAPGLETGRIRRNAVGRLVWKGLRVGGKHEGPRTADPVWTIPREVDAASVRTVDGEDERYLFYRGVANLDAPVRVIRSGANLKVLGDTRAAWMVAVAEDGRIAFARWRPGETRRAPDAYAEENLTALLGDMRDELVNEGLFPREADAMLRTWENSYFRSPGARLFYLVPREWTDRHLPLSVSGENRITRVMVGRIEMVTPGQRRLLEHLAAQPPGDPSALREDIRLLGRFSHALLAEHHRRNPTEGTRAWADALQLTRVPD